MAKRFTDTTLGRQAWFRKLSPAMKCAWRFLWDECNYAGAWSIDEDAFEFHIGERIDIDALIQAVNQGEIRLKRHGKDQLFLVGFVAFQYGKLSEDCKPHKPVIKRLKELTLWEGYLKGLDTLKEKEKDQEKEKETEEETETGNTGEAESSSAAAAPLPDDPPPAPVTPAGQDLGAETRACAKTWEETLAACGRPGKLSEHEITMICRAIQRWGAEYVDLALFGARFEPKGEKFNPKEYLSLARVFGKGKDGLDRIDQFVGWGRAERKRLADRAEAEARHKAHQEAAKQPAFASPPPETAWPEEEYAPPPEDVRKLLGNLFGDIPKEAS